MNVNMKNVKISGIRKFYNEVQKVDGAISLTLGQPDFELPKAIKDGLIKAINENKTREDQEWEMIKEKYDYDELKPERQQIVEQQFHEMIYKRRMREIGIDDNLFDDIKE